MVYFHGFQMCLAVQILFKESIRKAPLCKYKEALVKEIGVLESCLLPSPLPSPRTSEG